MADEFGGVIGPSVARVDAVVAAGAASRPRARPTWCSSCSTTSASRSSAATAPTSRPRTSTASRPAACGSPTSTPPRCARRRGRACSPGATTTRNGMGRVADLAIGLPRLLRAHPARERLPLRDPRARTGYATVRGRQVAPHARGRDPHGRATAAAWPLGRGFDRWYGFHGGETHQFVPTLYHDNHSVRAARARPTTATTSPRTSPTARSSTSATCARSTPTSRSSSTSRPARATRRTTRRRSGSSATAASSTTGWDAWRERRSPASSAMGLLPDGHRAVAAAAVGAGVGRRSSPRTSAVAARFMECFAGVPLAHRRADRPACSTFLERARRARRHARRRSCPTTARAPRAARTARSTTRASWNGDPAGRRGAARRASTSSAGRPRTTTTRGAGRWPATRRSGAGSARCTRAASPTRASCAGRAASPARGEIRHQFAHAIDVLPTVLELDRRSTRPTEIDGRRAERRSTARASPYLLDDADARRAPHHAVLRDARQPRASTTTGGRR